MIVEGFVSCTIRTANELALNTKRNLHLDRHYSTFAQQNQEDDHIGAEI